MDILFTFLYGALWHMMGYFPAIGVKNKRINQSITSSKTSPDTSSVFALNHKLWIHRSVYIILILTLLIQSNMILKAVFVGASIRIQWITLASLILNINILGQVIFIRKPSIQYILRIMLPIASVLSFSHFLLKDTTPIILPESIVFYSHFFLSIMAYGVFLCVVILSFYTHMINKSLHHLNTDILSDEFPALLNIESILFTHIRVAFILLSCAIISGLLFMDIPKHLFLMNKTLLGLFSWLILLVLLIGRAYYGWRGKQANIGIMISFLALLTCFLLAYTFYLQ